MWNIRFLIYIVIVALLSLIVVIKEPKMHKQVIITDSDYEFVDVSSPNNDIKIEPQGHFENTNINVKNVEPPKREIKINNHKNIVRQQPKKVTSKQEPKKVTTPQKTEPKPKAEQTVTQPKQTEVKPPVKDEPKKSNPVLTEEEEIIAWNHWRSRLQNQVMMDSKISAPLGTQFKFSFTVDKYGNMSNVKVWSTNPTYSDLAVRTIKPVLMSYRNKPILNFPYGTQRIITNVTGGFVISRISRYSSPSDYNDYEHVKR